MADSCMSNPSLDSSAVPDALVRAMTQHNHLPPPSYLKTEATRVYLAPRADGLPSCTPDGNASHRAIPPSSLNSWY